MSDVQIRSAFVAGAGLMGGGIAQVSAQAGLQVTVFDAAPGAAERAIAQIEKRLVRAEQAQRLQGVSAAEVLSRLGVGADTQAAASADIVIEAVTEHEQVKLELFAELDRICPAPTVLASNTSSIPITRLAAATARPDRVIGMHFYSPVPLMELVELVRGVNTSDATYELVEQLGLRMGKVPVTSADTPGFIGNRILIPYLNEAIQALQEGVGSAEDIDRVAKLGFRNPMGPLELADFIGLDVVLGICRVMYRGLHDRRYAPNPLLERLVEAGHLGRKSGRGFHSYRE